MQIIVYKCEYCGKLFEKEKEYDIHINIEKEVESIKKLYPESELKTGEFVERNKKWYEDFMQALLKAAKKVHPKYLKEANNIINSYIFMRSIDDSGSPFCQLNVRLLRICNTCFREYDQPYYALNCKYCGKGENAKIPTSIKK